MIIINKVVELKNNRVEYERYLKNQYEKYYINVKKYIMSSSILDVQKEEVMSDVIEMFLDYQENNKDINLLLGEDHEKFCRETIESLKTTKLSKVYTIIKCLEIVVLVMIAEFSIVMAGSLVGINGLERIDCLDVMTLTVLAIFLGISIGKYRIKNIYTPWSINKLEFLKDIKFLTIYVMIIILIEHTLLNKILDFYVYNNAMILIILIGLILLFILNIIKVTFVKGMK